MQFDFTREELFEYFDGYTKEQVEQALITLHEKHDRSIDPNAKGYPSSITTLLEQIFKKAEETVAAARQLTGANLATAEQSTITFAAEDLDISPDAMEGIISIIDAEAAAEAYALYQRRKAVRDGVLSQLELRDLTNANKQATKRITALQHLCKDPETLDQILVDYGLLTQNEATRVQVELTASCSLDFDPDKFLLEVSSEKKSQSKTIGDTQRLAKVLLKSALQ